MKKLADLRRMLLESVPALGADPARVELYVDRGGLNVRQGSLSFEYAYQASIWVQEFSGSIDTLLVPLLAWISEHQPELMQRPDRQPFTFEAEILDADVYDVLVTVELTELVRVARDPAGLRVEHLDEPRLADQFVDVPAGTRLWQGLLDDLAGGTSAIVP